MIAGNWKMNLNHVQAVELASSLAAARQDEPDACDVAVFPSFPWILPVSEAIAGSGIAVGAQNCHTEPSGAFTGEVSPSMLSGICQLILAGHSERRHIFGESDELVGAKVAAILNAGIDPVLCVGETIDERNAGDAAKVVTRHVRQGLVHVDINTISRVTLAYEPVWAIGTGIAATPDDAQEMCSLIRSLLSDQFGDVGQDVRVLYGGSMTPDNASELLSQPDVDGGLVGGASLKADSFLGIINSAGKVAGL